MYAGMTRSEVRGLVALIVLIALGIGAQAYHRHRESGAIWIEAADHSSAALVDVGTVEPEQGPPELVDLNLATPEDFMAFGITRSRALAIVAHRDQSGEFGRVDQLLEVPGIGPKTLTKITPFVFVVATSDSPAPETETALPTAAVPVLPDSPIDLPVNINTASDLELQSLWNVGPKTAAKIIAWRAEHGRFVTAEDLMRVPGIGPETLRKNRHRIRVD